MDAKEIQEYCEDHDVILNYPHGCERAIIGIVEDADPPILALDYHIVIDIIMETTGQSYEDALDDYLFNYLGTKGVGTPIFIDTRLE